MPLVPGRVATTDDLIALRDELRRELRIGVGEGLVAHAQRIDVDWTAVQAMSMSPFIAKILNSDPAWGVDCPSNRWVYNWRAYRASGPDPTQWQATSRTGSARNLLEAANVTSGTQGNGVNNAQLPAGFKLRPVPPGTFVLIYNVPGAGYWFAYENGVDGTCQQ